MNTKPVTAALAALALVGLPTLAWGQLVIQDNFTGANSAYNWKTFDGACLTAGDGTGTIPKCVGLPYYGGEALVGGNTGTLPDSVGNGALRFTNGSPGGYQQAGSIISNFTYPSSEGLQVTFTTTTYRGDSGGAGGDGADGMAFLLMDGTNPAYDTGAFGGSLGYTCSNVNNDPHTRADGSTRGYDGLIGGYLGLGIDEYGNFLNGVSNLGPSPPNATGDNTATGYGYQPGRIGLRGAGAIAWQSLNALNPVFYPSTLTLARQQAAVQNTCRTGTLWNYSSVLAPAVNTGTPVADYGPIPNAYSVLPGATVIANESATTRGQAYPITYKLKITSAGLLSLSYSYNSGAFQQVITGQDITAGNGPLPATFRFGFAGSTGGSTNVHEVLCFQAAPSDTAASSAGLNEKQTARVQTGTQVYFAFYNPNTWAGSLTAQDLLVDSSTGLVSINPVVDWDASCVLSGIPASASCGGVSGPVAAQGWASSNAAIASTTNRVILTYNGSNGVPLSYGNLSTTFPTVATNQQKTMGLGDAAQAAGSLSGCAAANAAAETTDRVNFLRGDRSCEQTPTGKNMFRTRASVLGDIVNSSPTWVGAPSGPYPATWHDLLYPATMTPAENSGQSYPTFATNNATRLDIVWSGANDGLMHGFRSGSYTAAGVYVNNGATPNDGLEMLAYMPALVDSTIHQYAAAPPSAASAAAGLDFSNPQYGHNFFVDAPPGSGDVFYAGAWHSWLIGGLGAGGAAIYALDITDPTTFKESNAASVVIGEWNATTLTCANVAGCGAHLGNTYGVPQIRRFHNGMWGAVFGNGLGTTSAGIYIMTIDPTTGARTFYYLAAGAQGQGGTAGITYTTPVDLDGDHTVDYVYAGDVKGNVWRFDVTSNVTAGWGVSASSPLFQTPGGQPITTKLVVASTPSSNSAPRVLVDFGTGQQAPLTNSSATSYASGTQSLYGIWDWDMNSWNAKSSAQYASLTIASPAPVPVAGLQSQTVLAAVAASTGYRAVSSNSINWCLSAPCGAGTQYGWYLNLPGSQEQIIFNPVLDFGAFIVNTTIPAAVNPLGCTSTVASGWTMAISPTNGGSFAKSFFGDATGHFVTINGQIISGEALSGTGSVSVVTTGGSIPGTFLVTQTTSGVGAVAPINPTANATGSRLTWAERR